MTEFRLSGDWRKCLEQKLCIMGNEKIHFFIPRVTLSITQYMKGAFYEHTSKLSGRKCGGDRPLDY